MATSRSLQWAAVAVFCAGSTSAGPASAGGVASLSTRALAATCAACHGTEGRALRGDAVPPLAGLPPDYFLRQMRGFRDGSIAATVMTQIARGYSDDQFEALAEYFAASEAPP
jgi:cytochrome c553